MDRRHLRPRRRHPHRPDPGEHVLPAGEHRAGAVWSIAPGGLSSAAYNGHVFRDSETWPAPALLPQHPEIAVDVSTYRQTLPAPARRNTTACAPPGQTIRGARFPWESALTGKDTYTNAAARTALRIATRAAGLTGATADPLWTTVANGLEIPFDTTDQRHLEYDGYPTGETVKQADVTMTQYPWEVPMSPTVAQNDLDYYGAHTDVNGPSMTDPIAGIASAALTGSHCDSYTFLRRGVDPFLGAPFDQYREEKRGGAFTYITSAGGFLQQFQHSFTGLRWNRDAVRRDPDPRPRHTDPTRPRAGGARRPDDRLGAQRLRDDRVRS